LKKEHVSHYPLLVNLTGKHCVVIGGGRVAERKVDSLLEAGALVTVISPFCSPQIEGWEQVGMLSVLREYYQSGMREVAEALLVFAATDDPHINESVRWEAESMGKLVTVADNAADSSFIVPAVVRRGKLLIAVSTGGASPAIAQKIKQELEHTYGSEYEIYLELVQELRLLVQSLVNDTAVRQQMFRVMLGWELMALIRSGYVGTTLKQHLFEQTVSDPTAAGMERIGVWIQGHID
jgi:precorrin-2 dehydrogenase/sirohydrochlorin ferrochelatase